MVELKTGSYRALKLLSDTFYGTLFTLILN